MNRYISSVDELREFCQVNKMTSPAGSGKTVTGRIWSPKKKAARIEEVGAEADEDMIPLLGQEKDFIPVISEGLAGSVDGGTTYGNANKAAVGIGEDSGGNRIKSQ